MQDSSTTDSLHTAETTSERPWLGGWYWLAPILALASLRGFWAPDEPRYAQIAKEAWDSGSFLVLHLCGELYPDKPPLVYWLAGALGKLSGWSEFAMRVPSILATIGSAWLAAKLARRWISERVAAWTPAFYLGCAMVFEIGGRLQLDPLLSFFSMAALVLLADDVGGERAITRRTWLAGACLGLGALAKGPVAWVPVGLALVAWACLPKTLRFAPRRAWTAWIGLVVLALLPVVTWAALAIHFEPALARPLLFGQHIGRITKGDQHPGPVWDHLRSMPLLLLPWTFLFVAGASAAWRSFRQRENVGLVRIAWWFAVVFVFFSLIPPKRDLYLLPIYPAAAMIMAFAFDRMLRERRLPSWIGATTAALLAFVGGALAAAPLAVSFVRSRHPNWLGDVENPASFARLCVPSGIVLVIAGIVAWVAARRSNAKAWADVIGVGLALALTTAAFVLVPAVDADKCARKLAEFLATRPERPSILACVGVKPEGIRFYGGGPAGSIGVEEALERDGADFLAVCRDKEFDSLPESLRARVREVGRGRIGARAVLVLAAK